MAIYSIIPKCEGCQHVQDSLDYWRGAGVCCSLYLRPAAKWSKLGGCESATNVERQVVEVAKVRVGQQKQSKVKTKAGDK